MKKIILALAFSCAVLALSAEGDKYLYWMVEDSNIQFDYARVAATKKVDNVVVGVTYLNIYPPATDEAGNIYQYAEQPAKLGSDGYATDKTYGLLAGSTDWSSYSFVIELLNEDYDVKATGGESRYSDLLKYMISSPLDQPEAWTVSSFTPSPVPEPTSGLLMLLGAAVLALRRKRTLV